MSDYSNFTSLPPEQEAQFVVYERHQKENLDKGFKIAAISSLIFAVLALGVYFGVEPKEDKKAESMDLNQLKKKSKTDAPTPEAPAK
ncbi:MAG: hypothetical protein K8M05_14785 [Deltaproteobacteria bacterium]|nr:hypothetical protein [Kofleriaceae bacterium]